MAQLARYYPDLNLVYVQLWGAINLTSLAGRMAEWMYGFHVPKGYVCLTDSRALFAVDSSETGVKELINLQSKIYEDLPCPEKCAILVDSPVGFVLSRLFEQMAEGVLEEQVSLFRAEQDALRFLGFESSDLEALLRDQQNVQHMD
ncbi:hypothetical protein SAMN04488527_102101 [Aliiroseovarius crassostreae]|uniref:Uncharacterized protein n=1 Tax=Aliiroseovarius crassostreae TaxID=154981 RepID=A0A0P7KMF8_9RHOB|nr:hypothetical protein [Aliiroseovarius crassostreae]KPN63304.1 hypothetical protein AKJ29_11520 [Aliiroseovarius crassostreae]SFU41300.1 hypothetical protein SAMN04488527_102101 [Aliiroseovarius crassostreae]